MSRQLALSACFSIFAMSAFALSQGAPGLAHHAYHQTQTGAEAHATAPAHSETAPEQLLSLLGFPLS